MGKSMVSGSDFPLSQSIEPLRWDVMGNWGPFWPVWIPKNGTRWVGRCQAHWGRLSCLDQGVIQEVDLKGTCLQPGQLGFKYMNVFEAKTAAKKREHMESSPREKGSYHGRSLSETNIVTGKGYVQHWKAKYL
jgi:hypothetical protein